jgi:hypothetical protein
VRHPKDPAARPVGRRKGGEEKRKETEKGRGEKRMERRIEMGP